MLDVIDKKLGIRKKVLSYFTFDVNPNYVTFLGLVSGVLSGILFYLGYLLPAAVLIMVNGFFDILDGHIAKGAGKANEQGGYFDHVSDRITDVAIMLGIALMPGIPPIIGFGAIIASLMVSYIGTASHVYTKDRIYGGLAGRSERLFILFIGAVAGMFFAGALYYTMLLILVLSTITFIYRAVLVYKRLGEA